MRSNSTYRPVVDYKKFIVNELPNELLLYNLETHRVFALNQTSRLVWQNCDGSRNVTEIAKELKKDLQQNVPEELVWLTLERLMNENLITSANQSDLKISPIARREMIKKAALASLVSLPMITALAAPKAAQAQSGAGAAVCFECNKKINGVGTCPQFCVDNVLLGDCFDNSGCGSGQLLASGVSCIACFSGAFSPPPFNGTVSWQA